MCYVSNNRCLLDTRRRSKLLGGGLDSELLTTEPPCVQSTVKREWYRGAEPQGVSAGVLITYEIPGPLRRVVGKEKSLPCEFIDMDNAATLSRFLLQQSLSDDSGTWIPPASSITLAPGECHGSSGC